MVNLARVLRRKLQWLHALLARRHVAAIRGYQGCWHTVDVQTTLAVTASFEVAAACTVPHDELAITTAINTTTTRAAGSIFIVALAVAEQGFRVLAVVCAKCSGRTQDSHWPNSTHTPHQKSCQFFCHLHSNSAAMASAASSSKLPVTVAPGVCVVCETVCMCVCGLCLCLWTVVACVWVCACATAAGGHEC